jgi:Protein of unknown function (DUF1236)
MARLLSAVVALTLLVGFEQTIAQGPTQPPLASAPRINLTLEQQHIIKELIKDLKVTPAPATVKLAVGEAVPEGVTAQAMPVEIGQKVPQIKTHQFVLTANEIAIVDPKDHKVVELISLKS